MVFSFAVLFVWFLFCRNSFAVTLVWFMRPREGDFVTSLYLGSDRLPGAGFSRLHLTRMVVDLPELQDWVTSLDLQRKQPPWGNESLICVIGEPLSKVNMERFPHWGSLDLGCGLTHRRVLGSGRSGQGEMHWSRKG